MSFIPKVSFVEQNNRGRDFFVGDIHGCLSLLEEALARVSFDRSLDRLFSVGDMIDRGPNSVGVLRLLKEPWFYAVRGNHEDMFLCALGLKPNPLTTLQDFLFNGGNWFLYADKKELRDLAEIVVSLPHVITIRSGNKRTNVVHAELAKYVNGDFVFFTDDDIDAWGQGRSGTIPVDEPDLLWERNVFLTKKKVATSERLSPTVCGHTPGRTMRKNAGHINIDTGAFKKYHGKTGCLTVTTIQDLGAS